MCWEFIKNNLFNELIITLSPYIIGGKDAISFVEGKITLGVLVTFFAYIRNLFQPIRDLVEKYNTFLSAMVAAERVVSLLTETSETSDSELDLRKTNTDFISTDTSLIFNEVSFAYPSRTGLVLENVSFSIPSGTSVAIVGATGSGKSTLIRLLMRFYEPSKGEIVRYGYSVLFLACGAITLLGAFAFAVFLRRRAKIRIGFLCGALINMACRMCQFLL